MAIFFTLRIFKIQLIIVKFKIWSIINQNKKEQKIELMHYFEYFNKNVNSLNYHNNISKSSL